MVGLVRLRCQVLVTPETGIRMRILLPLERTDAAEKLELLHVIGTQFLDANLTNDEAGGASPGERSGATLTSSAADLTPMTGTSDKSQSGPATRDTTPLSHLLDRHRGEP